MKFNVRDEDGNVFEVEEVTKQEETDCGGQLPQNEPAKASDDELSVEEIASLKKLASVAEKLISLIPADDAGADPAATGDEDPDENEDDDEETVVETGDCGAMPAKKDSLKKSVGANEPKTRANDSDIEDVVSIAWAKRYGGKK